MRGPLPYLKKSRLRAGSPELAASHQISTAAASGKACPPAVLVPSSAFDDEQVIVLRALGESYGRRVLVQNLRHVVVGLAGYRALWTDFIQSSCLLEPTPDRPGLGKGGGVIGGERGESMTPSRQSWMVKVVPEVASYQEANAEGVSGKWARVCDILPMSDYDLDNFNTYRHDILPSSEFDLQRHDHSLERLYGNKM